MSQFKGYGYHATDQMLRHWYGENREHKHVPRARVTQEEVAAYHKQFEGKTFDKTRGWVDDES